MSYRLADSLLASCQHNLYNIYLLLCVQYWTPYDEQRNCPKHVEFHSKNKFEQLVHLVGFIIWIFHDAPSPERQIHFSYSVNIQYAVSIHNTQWNGIWSVLLFCISCDFSTASCCQSASLDSGLKKYNFCNVHPIVVHRIKLTHVLLLSATTHFTY